MVKTDKSRGQIVDLVLQGNIFPILSATDNYYRIGDIIALITVQCDNKGIPKTAFCKYGKKILKFDSATDAKFVNDVCKKYLHTQIEYRVQQTKKYYR